MHPVPLGKEALLSQVSSYLNQEDIEEEEEKINTSTDGKNLSTPLECRPQNS